MKKFYSAILALLIVFCMAGCNTAKPQNVAEESNVNIVSEKTVKTTVDDFWEYFKAFYGNYDVLEASKYSFLDVENIYEDVIINTSNSLGISTQQLYVNIQYRLNDSKVNDYQSYMKAYTVAMNNEGPMDESTINGDIAKFKITHKISTLNDTEIIELKKFIYLQCDSLKETWSIDASKYIAFDDVTEYKTITIQEDVVNEPITDGAQPMATTITHYIVNTSNGWKVLDLNILNSLQTITKDM